MKVSWIIVFVLVLIGAAAGAGYAGYNYGHQQGQAQALDTRNRFLQDRAALSGAQGAQAGPGGIRAGNDANFALGEVKQVDGNTIQLSTATEVLTVVLDGSTQILKTGPGTVDDIVPGERISVQGARGTDGAFAASLVQIGAGGMRGAFPGGGGFGANAPVPDASGAPSAPGAAAP